jgi:HupE / UreJ protein
VGLAPRLGSSLFLGSRLFLGLGLVLSASPSSAHHLEISRLEFRPLRGPELESRLFLDPKLPLGEGDRHKALRDFTLRNVGLRAGAERCHPNVHVLEVWNENSPAPGHLVDISCRFSAPPKEPIYLAISPEMGKIAVYYPTVDKNGADAGEEIVVTEARELALHVRAFAPPKPAAEPPQALKRSWKKWVLLGFDHVLPEGLDHVLFVVALVLGTYHRLSALLRSVLVFTAFHAVGLYLGARGALPLPPSLIEPLIALSIVVLGGLVLINSERTQVDSPQNQGALVPFSHRGPASALFGTLHGLGFASAFRALEVPDDGLFLTLFHFHVGVELGHLVVLLVVLLFTRGLLPWLVRRLRFDERLVISGLAIATSAAGLAMFLKRIT